MRTREELIEIVRGAFKPLTCDAQPDPTDEGVEFWVHDGKKEIVGPHLIQWNFRLKDQLLQMHIESHRQVVELHIGRPLDPWSLPAVK